MAEFLDFSTIKSHLQKALNVSSGQIDDQIEIMVNHVYLSEILEADGLHDLYWLRNHNDGRRSVDTETISGATQASPCVLTLSANTNHVAGNYVMVFGAGGMTELNFRMFKVGGPSGATLQLLDLDGSNVDASNYTAYTSGGTLAHCGITLSETNGVKRVFDVEWLDEGPMNPVDSEELKASSLVKDSQTRPTRYMFRRRFEPDGDEVQQLFWFPCADDVYRLRYWFLEKPPRLSADADVPQIPPQFHDLLISGVLTRMMESGVQAQQPAIWPKIYTQQMDAMVAHNRKWYKKAARLKQGKPFML